MTGQLVLRRGAGPVAGPLSVIGLAIALSGGSAAAQTHDMHGASQAGILVTLPEGIPDFSTDVSRPSVQSAQSGSWSNAATWQGGVVPTSNHVVRVALGHTVTINDTTAVAYTVAVDGKLTFASNVNTRLKVTNLEVMAGTMGSGTPGVLEVGTPGSPIAANVTAEIVIADSPLGGSVSDPDQFGTGLIAFGKVSMFGSAKTPTFVRVAAEPKVGNTTLTLSEAVTAWRVGDRLVLPDTRHIQWDETPASGEWTNIINQWEERTLQAISADGKTLTLNAALQYDHLGARDLNNVLTFLPHVGNLTRNVIIRAENPSGTRGHVLFNHLASVDIRYALFKDLGRTTYLPLDAVTNHIGRYPIHFHHVSGPLPTPANGYQFTLIGTAVDGGTAETKFKWGITVHGSHYGLLQDNIVYNYSGASIATEDGSESFNVFDHNFALRGIGEPSDSVSEARMALGTEGVGFWFHGPNNYVRNNVAANFQNPTTEAAYGFVYQMRFLGNIEVPNFKGADTVLATGQSTTRDSNNLPLLQFQNNEAYGATQGGFTFWWVNSQDPQPAAVAQESIVKDLKLWHIYNKTVYAYPAQKVVFDGLKIRNKYSSNARCCGNGVYFADYSSKGIVIRNSDLQGSNDGITAVEAGFGPEPNLLIENSYLRNFTNVVVPTNGSVNGCWMQNKLVVLVNTIVAAAPGEPVDDIAMVRDVANAQECLAKLDEVRVYAHNGNASDNFQVYHNSASVLPRPPGTCTPTTRAGITGLLCTIAGKTTPTITWATPPPMAYGAALGATQLNATASVPGTFTYVPPSGTVLSEGVGQVLSVTFTPTDTTTFSTADATVLISVGNAPTIAAQPLGQTITSGQVGSLGVGVAGTSPLSYQWYVGPSGTTSSPIAGATTSTYTTPALTSTTSYWVRVTNAFGSVDSATAVVKIPLSFSDNPLTAGTLVRATHITELRDRIDTLRTNHGLAAYNWTDATLTVGVTAVRAVHVAQLRTALAEVYTTMSLTPPTYTDPDLTGGVVMKVAHVAELRSAVVAIE